MAPPGTPPRAEDAIMEVFMGMEVWRAQEDVSSPGSMRGGGLRGVLRGLSRAIIEKGSDMTRRLSLLKVPTSTSRDFMCSREELQLARQASYT